MLSTSMPGIKAILFDKDGTLLDFMETWYPLFNSFIDGLSQRANLDPASTRRLRLALGDQGGAFSADSIFLIGSFDEIFSVIEEACPQLSQESMAQAFGAAQLSTESVGQPIGNAADTLRSLREAGYLLGVATADREDSTRQTLASAGLLEYFDFIGCEDTVPNGKPAADLMQLFCSRYQLQPQNVAMVGDSIRDMEFARNSGAGQAVFVRSSFPDGAAEALADIILPDINALRVVADARLLKQEAKTAY